MIKKSLFIFLVCTCFFQSYGQSDFGVWTSADLKIPITKKLDVGLGINARFKSNVTEVKKTFLSPSINYKVASFLKLGADYRFANHPETGFFGTYNTHRITLDANFDLFKCEKERSDSANAAKFQVSARLRYSFEREVGDLNDENLRGQLKLEYSFPKDLGLKFYASAEMFFHYKDQIRYTSTDVTTFNRFNKMRIRAGLGYALNKRSSLELYYMVEPEFESDNLDFILGVGYTYELRRINKKRK